MFTDSDDGVASTTIVHSIGEGLEDSFLETRELGVVCLRNSSIPFLLPLFLSPIPLNLSHPLKPPPPISPSRRQYCQLPSISLSHARSRRSHSRSHLLQSRLISPRGRHWSHPLPSPFCPPFTLPLCGCGGFFFLLLLQFGLIWYWWVIVVVGLQ